MGMAAFSERFAARGDDFSADVPWHGRLAHATHSGLARRRPPRVTSPRPFTPLAPMKSRIALLLAAVASLATAVEIPSAEWQIKTAVLAAAKADQAGATVLGYDASGKLVTLRQGTNNFICLADNPKQNGFSVACYHKDLEPFMARGRELAAQGKKPNEVLKQREEDVKSGKFKMPDKSILNVTTGKVDAATGEVTELYTRYVIYIPYATPESTGIPLAPIADGAPWIMDAGTHRAHIMINPPKSTTGAKGTPASDEHKNHK
jgi:hypothetical protein